MRRILLLGCNGQVGWELQRSLQLLGTVLALDRSQAPLQDTAGLLAAVDATHPDVIVNAAAYTAVDKAESDADAAFATNARAPLALAQWAKRHGATLVHYSTDYVFDGSGSHFRNELAPTGPLSVYGASKLEGELAIAHSGCHNLVFRTSWVYAARGSNFAKTMLRLAREKEDLTVVNDQWGAPTGADLVADVTAHALSQFLAQQLGQAATDTAPVSPQLGGLYHLVAGGETHWQAYAGHVIETARAMEAARASEHSPIRVAPNRVHGVPTSAYPTPAKRPLNSRLNTQRICRDFGIHLPQWQTGVEKLIRALVEQRADGPQLPHSNIETK